MNSYKISRWLYCTKVKSGRCPTQMNADTGDSLLRFFAPLRSKMPFLQGSR
ncbi:MAG: hypothetical protein KatS3mg050_1685 [Litorilinea sp.]|nr:MAG: hypothetical protein KatS3mg050_1685 [Litorilinea sp.]